jgi:hypothetical protein
MRHNRGVPTEEVLTEMRSSVPPICYLVGTPKSRLSKLEADLLERPWQSVRPGVEVKVLPQDNELYVFAQSHASWVGSRFGSVILRKADILAS